MRILVKLSSFISFLNIYLSHDKSDATKNNIVKYFRRKSSLADFPPALEVSLKLIQVASFYLYSKFSVEKLMKLR